MLMAFNQNYNYHTHTYRSGHSRYVSDETILEAARSNGIQMLGFTEHIPNPELVLPEEDWKMLISEVDEYLESINGLKEKHPDMTILAGFEAEYDPMREAFLGEMRKRVDYMILGQHYVRKGLGHEKFNSPDYPLQYAKTVVDAIDSGLFDIVAHPDIFMKYRDQVAPEYRAQFDENAKIASRMICEKARDMGIPIEINLSPSIRNKTLSDNNLEYPHPLFWEIAATIEGLTVVKGIDAHSPGSFYTVNKEDQRIRLIEDLVRDKLIQDYNPVEARENNQTLKDALANRQATSLTFATHLLTQIIQGQLANTGNNLSSEELATVINQILDGLRTKCLSNAKNKLQTISEETAKIKSSEDIPQEDKVGKLGRKEKALIDINQVLYNQEELIRQAKEYLVAAQELGCETLEEFISTISQSIETTKQKTKEDIKQKRLIRDPKQSQGFVNTSLIPIAILIIVILIITICYLLLK